MDQRQKLGKIEARRKLKMKVNETKSDRLRSRLQAEYQSKDKEVKRSVRKDKREWAEHRAREAENAASQGTMKGMYEATKKLQYTPKSPETLIW